MKSKDVVGQYILIGVIALSSLLFLLKETLVGRMASLRSKLAHYQCQQRSTISSASKMVSDPGSHYFETLLLLQFGNVADTAA